REPFHIDPEEADPIGEEIPVPTSDSRFKVTFKPRQRPKVIRWKNYNEQQDRPNYLRSMLMLFHPWRNEPVLQPDDQENANAADTNAAIFELHKESIMSVYRQFVPNLSEDQLQEALEDNEDDESADEDDEEIVANPNEYEALNPRESQE